MGILFSTEKRSSAGAQNTKEFTIVHNKKQYTLKAEKVNALENSTITNVNYGLNIVFCNCDYPFTDTKGFKELLEKDSTFVPTGYKVIVINSKITKIKILGTKKTDEYPITVHPSSSEGKFIKKVLNNMDINF